MMLKFKVSSDMQYYLSGERGITNEVSQQIPSTLSSSSSAPSIGPAMKTSTVSGASVVVWFLHGSSSKVALEVLCIISWLGKEAKHTVHDTRH